MEELRIHKSKPVSRESPCSTRTIERSSGMETLHFSRLTVLSTAIKSTGTTIDVVYDSDSDYSDDQNQSSDGETDKGFDVVSMRHGDSKCLQASFHQADERRFNDPISSGSQCCAVAATALASAFIRDPSLWTRSDFNRIMVDGYELHKSIINGNINRHPFLNVDEISNRQYSQFGQNVLMTLAGSGANFAIECICSNMFEIRKNSVKECLDKWRHGLDYGQEVAIRKEDLTDFLICIQGGFATAIVKTQRGTFFYIDSHSRDPKGYRHGSNPSAGKACCIEVNFDNLVDLIVRNCEGGNSILDNFSFTPMKFEYLNNE